MTTVRLTAGLPAPGRTCAPGGGPETCASRYNTLGEGVGGVVAGAVLAAGGAVMAWYAWRKPTGERVSFAPLGAPGLAGLVAAGTF